MQDRFKFNAVVSSYYDIDTPEEDSEVIDFGFTDNRTGATLSTDKELTLLMPIVR